MAHPKNWIKDRAARLLRAHPDSGLALAGIAGRRFARWPKLASAPTPDEITALFGEMPARRLAWIRREIGALERRNQVLLFLARSRGLGALLPLVRTFGEERLLDLQRRGVPAILADWHMGVPLAHVAALVRLGLPTLALGRDDQFPPGHRLPESFQLLVGDDQRVSFLMAGLGHLRKGGLLLIGFNGGMGEARLEVPFLGRRVEVGRGAATLTRLADAEVIPVTCVWEGRGRIGVAFHGPLPRPEVPRARRDDYERAVMESAARWFEGWARAHPEQMRARWFRAYGGAERLPDRAAGRDPALDGSTA